MNVRVIVDEIIKFIKEEVGSNLAISALSGGVDSTTATVLARKALGEKVIPVFVDTGLLPYGEIGHIKKLSRDLNIPVKIINASNEFFRALKGVTDPELKRKIIGETFIRVFERIAEDHGAKCLIQGTIAPDWIESKGGIKSHHNVGGLPKEIKLKIVEPLKNFYKDEVREIARYIGIPEYVINKKPIPGPALAVRILGEVTPEKIEIVRKATKIVEEEMMKTGLDFWQAFAVLLPIRTVGVRGDIRAYEWTIAVRIVNSTDGMTANFSKVPWEVLERISSRITSEVPHIGRVLYDITNKPPATIEFE
ncbi:MAG: glutamine-hydrolyzing GMP synthase subunit GuaA [Thermoplasmata archaeon]|nr:MAG: glutamine-hydrolyzing GMP synthase subunit GuaA [Thermoplasmata archaeon]